jgi:hypothetical protein
LIFIITLILLIIGCSSQYTRLQSPTSSEYPSIQFNVHIDVAFTNEEQDRITNGIKSIECSTNYQLRFKINYDAIYEDFYSADIKDLFIWKTTDEDERIIIANSKIIPEKDKEKRFVLGLSVANTGDVPHVILIVGGRINSKLNQLTIHEVLHYLGLPHTKNTQSIMYPSLDLGAGKITKIDLETLADIYHLDRSNMRECNIQ